MSHPFLHPAGKELLKRVALQFTGSSTFILPDSNIVFVCGGTGDKAMRPRFCEYAKTELRHLRIFLAENAQKDYVTHPEPEFHNIGEFEDVIGEVSDCVVLFPESPGSFAELGYFSKNEGLRKKLLVVNDLNLQGQDSFIALGPINLIDKHSHFRSAIQINYGEDPEFHLIKERLDKRIPGKNRKRFEFNGYAKLEDREKFFSIFEIINLFQMITLEGVEYAFRACFKNVSKPEVKRLLSILVAAELVQRFGVDRDFFCPTASARAFFQFEGMDLPEFRLEVMDFYQELFPMIADLIRELRE